MKQIHFTEAYYIKLGAGGGWETECLDAGILRVGFDERAHTLAASGDWDGVRGFYADQRGNKKGDPTPGIWTNELRAFYSAPESSIWITISGGKLYWGFAAAEITRGPEQSRQRRLVDGWHCYDMSGALLDTRRISTRLTKTQGYRGTICEVAEVDYLRQKINATVDGWVTKANVQRAELIATLATLIQRLTWSDFELLVDLIFGASGWRRVSLLGGTEMDIDLDLEQVATGDRLLIQVKSAVSKAVIDDYAMRASRRVENERFYLVSHDPKIKEFGPTNGRLELFGPDRLAPLVLDSGLSRWVIEKSS